ncbi:hypothetical protein Rsub_12943 [Raphidocelis subcapitata]|uniref:Uncharacterized protein n=1 Tax=Raphidocelis subcapitata TaxID=307507 RepID=A0A2V0PJ49_9CHLO|nr:hypothetical protein Rsub_12943 [Raphidocelis subcapitata]|eukprot:GBF99828.1 hypothetical protein Rsub_12943 [Raphidocelis subcapitata]
MAAACCCAGGRLRGAAGGPQEQDASDEQHHHCGHQKLCLRPRLPPRPKHGEPGGGAHGRRCAAERAGGAQALRRAATPGRSSDPPHPGRSESAQAIRGSETRVTRPGPAQ